jgi:uncharacterized delta-60 repeat protein
MSDVKRVWRGLVVAPALAAMVMVGCGDDDGDDDVADSGSDGAVADASARDAGGPDGSRPGMDGGAPDASGPNIDAATDGGQPLLDAAAPYRSNKSVTDQTFTVKLSANGHDRFQGVAYDQAGNIYAVGFRSDGKSATSDYEFALAKFLPDGGADTTFGNGGVTTVNVVAGGQNLESGRGVVVQPDGKIVIAGDIDHQIIAAGVDGGVLARDKDLGVVRFNANGTLDTNFGTAGIVRENPGDGVITQTMQDGGVVSSLAAADSFWSLAQTTDGKLVIHLASRGDDTADGGTRTDTDYTLLRLNPNGMRDTTFNGTGVLKTDIARTNASARTASVLPDGKILGTGYTTSTVLTGSTQTAQQPVVYRVNANGTADTTFATTDRTATPGVWHDYARPDMKNAEAYTAGLQGTKLVTIGYGPTPGTGTGTDWVLFRFGADGAQDKSFGVGGAAFLDPGGYSDNGRGLAVLSDNRIIGVGVGRAKPATAPAMGQQPPRDGMIGIFGPDGQPDESFAPGGYKLYALGGDVDELHNVAVSPNGKQAAVVGVKGAASDAENDDAVLILLNTGL